MVNDNFLFYKQINHIIFSKAIGSKISQHNLIRESYRIRGVLTRSQISLIRIKHPLTITTQVITPLPINKLALRKERTIMARYSATNSIPNKPPPNSIFTPETNSLSASPRSQGERLSSATILISQASPIPKITPILPPLLASPLKE